MATNDANDSQDREVLKIVRCVLNLDEEVMVLTTDAGREVRMPIDEFNHRIGMQLADRQIAAAVEEAWDR